MIRRGLMFSIAAVTVMLSLWLWAGAHGQMWSAEGWRLDAPSYAIVRDRTAMQWFPIIPLAGAVLALTFVVVVRFRPFRTNLQHNEKYLLRAWIGAEILLVLVALALAHDVVEAGAAQKASEVVWRGVLACACLLIMAAADSLPKVRRNFFLMGLHTPWTHGSDLSWEKTHRLAGRLLFLAGLLGVIASFFLDTVPLAILIGGLGASAALMSVVYSYFVWRDDPNRRRPGWR